MRTVPTFTFSILTLASLEAAAALSATVPPAWLKAEVSLPEHGRSPLVVKLSPDMTPCRAKYGNEAASKCSRLFGLVSSRVTGVSLSPAVEGVWRWEARGALAFTPEDPWPERTTFKVDLSGLRLPSATTLNTPVIDFTTPPLTMTSGFATFWMDPAVSGERALTVDALFSTTIADTKAFEASVKVDVPSRSGLTFGKPIFIWNHFRTGFYMKLPVRTLSGVGAAAEKTLLSHGVRTLGAMGRADGALLRKIFGKNGEMMRDRALGRDRSEVAEDDEVKSVSNEVTYAHDLETREDIEAALSTIAAKVGRRLRRKGLKGRTVAVKMRYDNRTTRSAQCALAVPTDDDIAFAPVVHRLARELWAPGMKVRLLGVAVTHFEEDGAPVQEALFDAAVLGGDDNADAVESEALIRDEEKRRSLLAATDALQERFGDGTVRFGFELRQSGNTTGSSSKNVEDYK